MSEFSYGVGHDWRIAKISAVGPRLYVCRICYNEIGTDKNNKPYFEQIAPYRCPGPEAGKLIWVQKLREKNPPRDPELAKETDAFIEQWEREHKEKREPRTTN